MLLPTKVRLILETWRYVENFMDPFANKINFNPSRDM